MIFYVVYLKSVFYACVGAPICLCLWWRCFLFCSWHFCFYSNRGYIVTFLILYRVVSEFSLQDNGTHKSAICWQLIPLSSFSHLLQPTCARMLWNLHGITRVDNANCEKRKAHNGFAYIFQRKSPKIIVNKRRSWNKCWRWWWYELYVGIDMINFLCEH